MAWLISLNEHNLVDGFYPLDYHGTLPTDKRLIEVTDTEKERVYSIMPAYYDEADGIFKHWAPAPTLDSLKQRKKDEIAAARYDAETGGCTVDGVTIATDRGSQALLTAAVVSARLDLEFKTRWKCANGRFVTLDAMQLRAIGDAVIAHVEACFAREAELVEQIDAAQTTEDLDAIQWSM